MAAWAPNQGDTLLMPSGPDLHLFVLVLGPVAMAGYGKAPQIVLVNVSTIRDGVPFDPTCIIEPGEHPFIQKRSYVVYRHARVEAVPHVSRLVADATCHPHVPCPAALLGRVAAGICASRMTPREFKRIFGCL